ncbi:slide-domain-containing protein [Athelia psychrophila]|uniref:Slide-domain-containing protein n=1 Tax=Athelia psychrophila TaxID=1759441 RepID=A0A166GRP7_9AGAM|nr:slide-domain-containing protein [Fibularhizoctonia sp. CBS 109695]
MERKSKPVTGLQTPVPEIWAPDTWLNTPTVHLFNFRSVAGSRGQGSESQKVKLTRQKALRKVTCHPYLFDGAEPGTPYTTDEHIIQNWEKMDILDKLLGAIKKKGSRVLIFSQMSRILDILEDYCLFWQYKYCRIDGGTAHDDRVVIQQGRQQQTKTANKGEFMSMITESAEKVLNAKEDRKEKPKRKSNYLVDTYFKDTLHTRLSKTDKAPKQVAIQDFQFFDPALAVLQDRKLALPVHRRLNGIAAMPREATVPKDTPEKLEEERVAAQEFIDNAVALDEDEQAKKEAYFADGFPDWSWRDFQQFVRALEANGWSEDWDLLATDIQDKTPQELIHCSEYPRIEQRIVEDEAKRNKRSNLESLLLKKIASVKYPMQELELNYPTTKRKRIKKDITEFPVFRFDLFFKSRSPQELQRRCNALLGMIEKEAEVQQQQQIKARGVARGKDSPTPSTSAAPPVAKKSHKKKKVYSILSHYMLSVA